MQLSRLRELYGGRRELQKAALWNLWLAAKWGRSARAVDRVWAALGGRRLGNPGGGPPERPVNAYMAEHVEFLEAFDGVFAQEAEGGADRNSIEILRASWQLQSWRLAAARSLVEEVPRDSAVLEPLAGDGALGYQLVEEGFAKYVGYGPDVELASRVVPGAGWHKALSACDLRVSADVVLLVDKAAWFVDVVKELRCLGRALKPGGLLLVAEPDPALAPAYAAALLLMGALHVLPREQLYKFLRAAGFVQMGRDVEAVPYVLSAWRKPARPELSPSDRWME